MPRSRRSWPPGPDREVFTTGEVARLCRVTIKTVIRWFESGALKGWRLPDSRDRRFARGDVVAFMRSHGLPLDELEAVSRRRRILIVDDEAAVLELLLGFLEPLGLFEIKTATNGYEAGALTMSFKPDLLIVDYNLGDVTGLDVARTVRSEPLLRGTRILCMSGILEPEEARRLVGEGIDDFIPKPLDLQDLRGRIYRLLEMA